MLFYRGLCYALCIASVQIATVDVFGMCEFSLSCIQETGVETIAGGWLTCKAVILFPRTQISIRMLYPELAFNFWFQRVPKHNLMT